jgi:hypothetical protein
LYDHQNDPYEWYNLAEDAEYDLIKKELRAWLPKVNVPDVDYKEKKKYWPGDPTIK